MWVEVGQILRNKQTNKDPHPPENKQRKKQQQRSLLVFGGFFT